MGAPIAIRPGSAGGGAATACGAYMAASVPAGREPVGDGDTAAALTPGAPGSPDVAVARGSVARPLAAGTEMTLVLQLSGALSRAVRSLGGVLRWAGADWGAAG